MVKALPAQPHIDWLKKAAKQRLSELRADDPSARLHQAQLGIAKEYGFKNWRALKAHVDAASLDGQIISAAVEGDVDRLARLLAEHPGKLDITGGQWKRPLLHLAAEAGHLACIELLLTHGADVQQRDRLDNATALHWAAHAGRLDVVKRLVDAGADIDGAGDAHELGVIGWATCFRHVHQKTADWLLANGAQPTIFASIALGRADLVQGLAERDSRVVSTQMSRFECQRMPLHFAVLKNLPEMVELLLRLGADVSQKDAQGNTPLNYATPRSNPRIVELLIASGADPADQSPNRPNRFESAVPILNVSDVPTSIAYYVEKLGFRKEWDWGSPPTFGCVSRDQVRIFLCKGAQGGGGTWLSVFVQDVDALYKDYQRTGATIRQPPTNFPRGVREMNIEDLDGHRLRMGSDATGPSDEAALNEAP